MDTNLDIQIEEALKAYLASGVEDQVDYQKFYLYSIVTHSTAIEGSTVTEIENQLLFDEGIAAKGRSLTEQMMNVDLKDAYLYAFKIVSENPTYTPQLLQQLSALVMRRTGGEYSTKYPYLHKNTIASAPPGSEASLFSNRPILLFRES